MTEILRRDPLYDELSELGMHDTDIEEIMRTRYTNIDPDRQFISCHPILGGEFLTSTWCYAEVGWTEDPDMPGHLKASFVRKVVR